MTAKNYQNGPWFDKFIAKINGAVFYSHGHTHGPAQFEAMLVCSW